MFTNKPWLLYGATGRTGTMIAEEAVARGHRPVLAGRDSDRFRVLAERLGLPWTAGPFGATAPAALPLVARVAGALSQRPTTSDSAAPVHSHLWAQATADDGRSAHGWVRTGEGYAYTARSAVLAVEAALGSEPLGATTVARAFGSELSFAAGGELLAAA
jgi:hypothetical protein